MFLWLPWQPFEIKSGLVRLSVLLLPVQASHMGVRGGSHLPDVVRDLRPTVGRRIHPSPVGNLCHTLI